MALRSRLCPALIFLALGAAGAPAQSPVADILHRGVYRIIDRSAKLTQEGAFDFAFGAIRQPAPVAYVNVLLDANGDGEISRYPLPGRDLQNEWVVQNVPLPMTQRYPSEPLNRILFDFSDPGPRRPGRITSAVIVTSHPLALTLPLRLNSLSPGWSVAQDSLLTTQWGVKDHSGRIPDQPTLQMPPFPILGGYTAFEVPGPLDPKGLPDLAQEENECAPTSFANSLLYLAQRQGFAERLPRDAAGALDTARLVRGLKRALKKDEGFWAAGVSDLQFRSGQDRYINALQLPLRAAGGPRDSNAQSTHAFPFLVSQLKRGAGVQLGISWPDSGGHWVTVAGYAVSGRRAFIYVHDPDDGIQGRVIWELAVDNRGQATDELIHPSECTADLVMAQAPDRQTPESPRDLAQGAQEDWRRIAASRPYPAHATWLDRKGRPLALGHARKAGKLKPGVYFARAPGGKESRALVSLE